jgi:hypothetical protein
MFRNLSEIQFLTTGNSDVQFSSATFNHYNTMTMTMETIGMSATSLCRPHKLRIRSGGHNCRAFRDVASHAAPFPSSHQDRSGRDFWDSFPCLSSLTELQDGIDALKVLNSSSVIMGIWLTLHH